MTGFQHRGRVFVIDRERDFMVEKVKLRWKNERKEKKFIKYNTDTRNGR